MVGCALWSEKYGTYQSTYVPIEVPYQSTIPKSYVPIEGKAALCIAIRNTCEIIPEGARMQPVPL